MKEYWCSSRKFSLQITGPVASSLAHLLVQVWEEYLLGSQFYSLKKWSRSEGDQLVSISLSFLPDAEIKKMNSQYRNKDYATDVLSFPSVDEFRSLRSPLTFPLIHLGDLAIAQQVAERQGTELGVSLEQEMIHLAHHGFLHLLGFDHEHSTLEEEIMLEQEQILLDLTVLMRPPRF